MGEVGKLEEEFAILKCQANNFIAMQQEAEVEMINYEEELFQLRQEQALREGATVSAANVLQMVSGLDMSQHYMQGQGMSQNRAQSMAAPGNAGGGQGTFDILGSLHNASLIQTDLNLDVMKNRSRQDSIYAQGGRDQPRAAASAQPRHIPNPYEYEELSFRSYQENQRTMLLNPAASREEENKFHKQTGDPKVSTLRNYDGYIDFEA